MLGMGLMVKSTGTNPRSIENPVEEGKDKIGEVGREENSKREKRRKFNAIIVSSAKKKAPQPLQSLILSRDDRLGE